MANSILRQTIHTSLAKTVLNEVGTRSVKYYFSYGRTNDWEGLNIPDAVDNLAYEFAARKNTVFLKEITPSDVCLVIPRYNWVSGAVYDYYDYYTDSYTSFTGATKLEDSMFYVLTDELNVYLCLDNNNDAASSVKPTGTSPTEFVTSDNYVWKFMYTIPPALGNKFLSTTRMPVANAVQNMYYSDGKLEKFFIENKGSGYLPNEILSGTVSSSGSNYRKLYGTGTSFTTKLVAGDWIMVNEEVRQVQSVQSNTELTLKADGQLLYVGTASTITKLNTYLSITDGDGFKAENPYTITSIEVTDGGHNYGSGEFDVSVEVTSPALTGGRVAQATATVVAGSITAITLIDSGFGYDQTPTITIVDNRIGGLGSGATAVAHVAKTKAYLEPIVSQTTGEIINIIPKNTGIGYTFCNITPVRYHQMEFPVDVTSWTDAVLSVNFDTGKLDTKQADVELSAKNGAIHMIRVTTQGEGYKQGTTVVISGDGTGCIATPVIDETGSLKRIVINEVGADYTYANVTIVPAEGTNPSTPAVAHAVVSPPGGHGKSAVDELFGRTVSFFNRLSSVTVKSIPLNVDYRQVCLYRQPRVFNGNLLYNGNFGSTAYRFVVSVPTGSPALSEIPLNSILEVATSIEATTKVRFRLIGRTTTDMLMQAIDNNDEIVEAGLIVIHPNNVNYYTISVVDRPDIEKLSGDVIYIDNRQPFKPLPDQTVSISSRFEF